MPTSRYSGTTAQIRSASPDPSSITSTRPTCSPSHTTANAWSPGASPSPSRAAQGQVAVSGGFGHALDAIAAAGGQPGGPLRQGVGETRCRCRVGWSAHGTRGHPDRRPGRRRGGRVVGRAHLRRRLPRLGAHRVRPPARARGRPRGRRLRRRADRGRAAPLRDALVRVEQQVGTLERDRTSQFAALETTIAAVHESTAALGRQTQSLAGSLNSSTVRGAWGEVQLRRVLEHAGLLARCDFDEQVCRVSRHQRQVRPDVVVRLPGDKYLVIDAKAPMGAFLAAQARTCPPASARPSCARTRRP